MDRRIDPIRENYYDQLRAAEHWGDGLFYLSAVLSFVVLIGPIHTWPAWLAGLEMAFLVSTVAAFSVGLVVRLYFAPRAESRRREDLLSNAFDVPLTHERTSRYYNNEETQPFRRLGMNVLENAFHSKDTALEMCQAERVRLAIYVVVWLLLAVNRVAPLEWVVVAAQVLFSEQLIARWMRLEWFRIEVERLYERLLRFLQTQPSADLLQARVVEDVVSYESAKARAGMTLSQKIFDRRNATVSALWAKVRATIPVQGPDVPPPRS